METVTVGSINGVAKQELGNKKPANTHIRVYSKWYDLNENAGERAYVIIDIYN